MGRAAVPTSATTPTAPTCVPAEKATTWTWMGTRVLVSIRAILGGVCCDVV